MNPLVYDILNSCGNGLCLDMRFIMRPLMALDRKVGDTGGLPSCDGTTMTFDPGTAVSDFRKDPNLVGRAMAHIVFHSILGHHRRSDDPLTGLAEDMVVEYILDSLDTPHTSVPGREDRMYACEKIFKRCGEPTIDRMVPELRKVSQWQMQDYVGMFIRDDHSRRGPVDEAEWSETAKQVMTEVEGFTRNLDGRTGALMSILHIRNRRRYDYRSFLRRFMTAGTTVRENTDEFDYIYYSYGLSLYGNMPLIDSLEYSDTPHVEDFVIAIDTSGSTMRGPVMRFIEEAFDAARQSGVGSRGFNLHVIQCDDEVRSDDVIRSEQDLKALMSSFELRGGGGTDFRPVFDYVDSLVESGELRGLEGLMYFTDGLGTYPCRRPAYETAFVFCDSGYAEHITPPWAIRISIQSEDLMR